MTGNYDYFEDIVFAEAFDMDSVDTGVVLSPSQIKTRTNFVETWIWSENVSGY